MASHEFIREKFGSEATPSPCGQTLPAVREQEDAAGYPAGTEAYEASVDGYEFRLQEAEVKQGTWDGVIRLGIYSEGQMFARLLLDSVFRIEQRTGLRYEQQLRKAGIRIAVLHWLKLTGLAERFGPYFPGDYAYLAEESEEKPLSQALAGFAFPNPPAQAGSPEEKPASLDIELELQKEEAYYDERRWDSSLDRRGWECCINGYNFRQIHNTEAFHQIRRHYEVCWPSDEEWQGNIFFAVERNGRYVGLVTMADDVVQQVDYPCWQDDISVTKVRIAVLVWMRHNKLSELPTSLNDECCQALVQDFAIEPLREASPWENMSLRQMLSLPETEIGRGYYLHLHRKLYATPILAYSQLPLEGEEEMVAYLHEGWPCTDRIFSAAWAGVPEAQYVMHLLYADGYCLSRRDYRRSGEWYRRAMENGWGNISPEQADIRLTGFKLKAHKFYALKGN